MYKRKRKIICEEITLSKTLHKKARVVEVEVGPLHVYITEEKKSVPKVRELFMIIEMSESL